MTATNLSIYNLRSLAQVEIQLHPRINIFTGGNGAGKSTILEAFTLLGLSRSFRTRKVTPLFGPQDNAFRVEIAWIGKNKIRNNLRYTRDKRGLSRVFNGEKANKLSDISRLLPLVLLNENIFSVAVGTQKEKRAHLDWGVFHVEQDFYPVWVEYKRALKQRNSALRSDKMRGSVTVWDSMLNNSANKLDSLRARHLSSLQLPFNRMAAKLLGGDNKLDLVFNRGWDADKSLQEYLVAGFERDRKLGYTYGGAHRASYSIGYNGKSVEDMASRGEQKILASSLKLAQCQALSSSTQGEAITYLIDDLDAELDGHKKIDLVEEIEHLNSQVLLTTLNGADVAHSLEEKGISEYKLFHVEHGEVRPF